jgi:predicted DCC family thiol-disulfide oxidoreductase YuxK
LIVIFDGKCNLCESSVIFIICRDKKAKFKFVPAQSQRGIEIQNKHDINAIDLQTLILIKDGKVFTKSDAVLEIARNLDRLWKMLFIIKIIPKSIREWMYSKVAKNRYQWFGTKESCIVPTENMQLRFLK